MRGAGTMAIPPILVEIYEALAGIFTGAVGITFLTILALFLSKFIFDFLMDWIFKSVRKYIDILFFPGSFFHQLWHSLMIRILGYGTRVNFSMSVHFRDISSVSLIGELRSIFHAFLIGLAPILNLGITAVLLVFNQEFHDYFVWVNFPLGQALRIYLIICFVYFALPDWGDLMLPFQTATAHYSEIMFLLMIGFINFVIAISIWGWGIPLIGLILYIIAVIYLAQKNVFDGTVKPFKKGFEATEEEKEPAK